MSVEIMGLVFKCYPGNAAELALALALADHAHDDGTNIFPSVSTLAEKSRQSESTVQRQLRMLREVGWLIPVSGERGGRRVTRVYRIDPAWIERASSAVATAKRLRKKGVTLTPFAQANSTEHVLPQTGTRTRAEPQGAQAAGLERSAVPLSSLASYSQDEGATSSCEPSKGCQPDALSGGLPAAERVSPEAEKGVTAMTPESSGTVSKSKTPQPPHEGANALTRVGRKSKPLRGESLRLWYLACAEVDWVRQSPGMTWADARGRIASDSAHVAIERIGGYKRIADRTQFTQGELRRLFRQHVEDLLDEAGAVPPDVGTQIDGLLRKTAMPGSHR